MSQFEITEKLKDQFNVDGVVVLRGLFTHLIDLIAEAVDQNLESPSPYAAENLLSDETGRFFDDYCNWQRLPTIKQVIYDSEAGRVAAALMRSQTAQLFHDHILVKEPAQPSQHPGIRTALIILLTGSKP